MAGRRRSQKTEYYFDYSLLFIILFLTGFGLVMIYSASAYDATTQNLNEDYYLMHQAFAAALGLVGMFFVSHIPYHFWERFAVIGYVVSLILIALVLSPLGVEVNGARRWLNLGMSIQPAEIAKLAMILFLATLGMRGKKLLKAGLSLLLGGAFSNTYDRVMREYVVDYVSLKTGIAAIDRVVFNLADLCILIGTMAVVLGTSGL